MYNILHPGFQNVFPCTWELVRNTNSEPLLQSHEVRNSGLGLSNLHFNNPDGGSRLKTTPVPRFPTSHIPPSSVPHRIMTNPYYFAASAD